MAENTPPSHHFSHNPRKDDLKTNHSFSQLVYTVSKGMVILQKIAFLSPSSFIYSPFIFPASVYCASGSGDLPAMAENSPPLPQLPESSEMERVYLKFFIYNIKNVYILYAFLLYVNYMHEKMHAYASNVQKLVVVTSSWSKISRNEERKCIYTFFLNCFPCCFFLIGYVPYDITDAPVGCLVLLSLSPSLRN